MPLKARKRPGSLADNTDKINAPVSGTIDDPDEAIAAGEVSDTDDELDEDEEEDEDANDDEDEDDDDEDEEDDNDGKAESDTELEGNLLLSNNTRKNGKSKKSVHPDDFSNVMESLQQNSLIENDADSESDDEVDSDYEEDFQKFQDYSLISNLEQAHPEIKSANYDEVVALSRVVRNNKGDIVDPMHSTVPFITKYEKAKLIGAKASVKIEK